MLYNLEKQALAWGGPWPTECEGIAAARETTRMCFVTGKTEKGSYPSLPLCYEKNPSVSELTIHRIRAIIELIYKLKEHDVWHCNGMRL